MQPNTATISDIECPTCHGESFVVIEQRTGLLRCEYCRNQWIDERFINLTDTEKFLREQAKQPRVVMDNTTDTDKQLLDAIGGLVNSGGIVSGILGTVKSIVLGIVGFIVALIVIALVLTFVV